MKIAEYITEKVFAPRLKSNSCLVIYDPDRRYRELCLKMADEKTAVIDASEGSILSRYDAQRAFNELGNSKNGLESLLIYIPARKPLTDEEKLTDPFSIYSECGAAFPNLEGDDFLTLCLSAKPDDGTEIRRLFAENHSPTFAMVDSVGGGVSYPQLSVSLKASSVRDILVSLLTPTEANAAALAESDAWVGEAKNLLRAALGMELKTRSKSLSAISNELWRFILFSEFVFDLPGELPVALKSVPVAVPEAESLINAVCDEIRSNIKKRQKYIEKAEEIESDLNLPQICARITDFGTKDTFPFEERTFFKRAIDGIANNNSDVTRTMLLRHKDSVWQGKGETKAQWNLVKSALDLVEKCRELEKELAHNSQSQAALLDFYVRELRSADSLQREFEQAVSSQFDHEEIMHGVITQARSCYRRLIEKAQAAFIKHLETDGWTPEGRLANAEVFDKFVSAHLRDRGKKVAFLMVDALRYELGVELRDKIVEDDFPVELKEAYAQLPTITLVGMASLLPGAASDLVLNSSNGKIVPIIQEHVVSNVRERMNFVKKSFNDRFAEMTLEEFLRAKPKIPATADLLILRSTEIDSQLESNPESTLSLIPQTLKMIRAALHKLRSLGFQYAVIATDHGFFLNAQAEAGDVCAKPVGQWDVSVHDRIMLGDGSSDASNLVLPGRKLGILGSFPKCATPRSMAPYSAGYLYFHGGASLQEAVVPVLTVRLATPSSPGPAGIEVSLSYRNGAKKITTRLPVVEVAVRTSSLFDQHLETEILVEAQDEKGNVVGEPRLAGEVNPATRTLTIRAGETKQIVMQMFPEFEGKFVVKALDPTNLTTLSSIDLRTDYTV